MRFHRNAKLGLAGHRELVLAIAGGCSIREAAVTFNVSPATGIAGGRAGRAPAPTSVAAFLPARSLESTRAQPETPRRSAELEQAIAAKLLDQPGLEMSLPGHFSLCPGKRATFRLYIL